MLPTFTAMTFLAVFASERPAEFRRDPERIATIAIAAERAQSALIATWRRSPRLLGASMAATVLEESWLVEAVHDGTRRSQTGDTCLMQVSPVNERWQRWGTIDALAGIDLAPTTRCLLAGTNTLIDYDRYCSRRKQGGDWLRRMVSGYAGTSCKVTELATKRAQLTNRIAWTNWQPTESHRQAIAWTLTSERLAMEE
jgi:hypothetical protein